MVESYDVSRFNPAQHKMNRINFLSQIINEAKLNLTVWNLEWNDWNYNVYFNALKALYGEVYTKFTDDEILECERIKKAIEECLSKYPIQEKNNRGKYTHLDYERLTIFKKHIEDYEQKVKKKQEKHGLDTPNMEDEEGL